MQPFLYVLGISKNIKLGRNRKKYHQASYTMANAYETHEGGSEAIGFVGARSSANMVFPNPMGGVQNAQMVYYMH